MKLAKTPCVLPANVRIVQYLATFTGNLYMVCIGIHFGWVSPSLLQLLDEKSHIPVTNDEGSWIATLLLVGTFCSSCVTGWLLKKLGRKTIILLSTIPLCASWVIVAFAQTVYVFMVGRFLSGIAAGLIFSVLPLYISEISDSSIRGLLTSSTTLFWIFGSLIGDVIGSNFTIKEGALILSTTPIISLLLYFWMPESAYHYIMKGDLERAKRSLTALKRTNDVEEDLKRLVQAAEEQMKNRGKFLDLFTVKSNRKSLMVSLGARTFQQLTGTSAFIFYAQIIFKETGDVVSPSTSSLIFFATQILVCGFSTVLVDKTGRKPLMIVSLAGCALVLATLGSFFYVQNLTDIDVTHLSLLPVVSLIAFVIVFNIGMQTVPMVVVGEIFAASVRPFGASITSAYFSVIVIVISKFFQITKDEFGLHVPFLVFSISCVLGLFFLIFYVPETKGKTLEEIQNDLNSSGNKAELAEPSVLVLEVFRKVDDRCAY